MIPWLCSIFLRIALAIQGLLWLYENIMTFFCISLKNVIGILMGNMHPYVHCSIIHSGQDMEVFFDRCSEKEVVVHIYKGILLSHNMIFYHL